MDIIEAKIIRADIEQTGNLEESEIRDLIGDIIPIPFYEERCVLITIRDKHMRDSRTTVSIEIPKPRHFNDRWVDQASAEAIARASLEALQTRILEYQKFRRFSKIRDDA